MARGSCLVALIGALLPLGCGGGGGGGSPTAPPAPTPTPAGITFTSTAGASGILLAQNATSTSSTLVLDLRAVQVSGVYAVAFDLDYPSTVLHFQDSRTGTFLAGAGAQVATQVVETAPGHLVVGLSRLGPVAGVSGTGVLLDLDFTAVATGSGALTFSKNSAFGADGSPLPLAWGAGTVAVVR